MKIINALVIAKYIIGYCCVNLGRPISNLQVNKILYFIQREAIKVMGVPAFYNDIVAWRTGTVIPDVYYEFSPYAGIPIVRIFPDVRINNNILKAVINSLACEGSRLTAWQLVELSKTPNTAWDRVYHTYGGNSIIPISEIKKDVLNTMGG